MPVLTVPISEISGFGWGPALTGWIESSTSAEEVPLVFSGDTATVTLDATSGSERYRVCVNWSDRGQLGSWSSPWFALVADTNLYNIVQTTLKGT